MLGTEGALHPPPCRGHAELLDVGLRSQTRPQDVARPCRPRGATFGSTRYRSTPGPSLKSEGTNVCGSAGSVSSACCRGVSGTSGGGSTRALDHAIWETQYLKSRVRRSWSAFHGAVPCITASENNTTDPAGTSGMTTQEAFSGASWIWRGSLNSLL